MFCTSFRTTDHSTCRIIVFTNTKGGVFVKRIGLALLVLILACSSWVGLAFAQPIKIGVFEPMTGPSAAGGEMTVEGIELAWEIKPEVLGRPVEIIVVDNKSDKVEAANAVSSLIDKDNVVAIIGSYGSSLSMAAGDIVKQKKVPAVGCSPTNPLVTLNNDYYFRVCFIDPFQGTVMANYAVNELGAKTAAVIQDVTNDYSVGLSKYFIDTFIELTGDENSIVIVASYNDGDKDFTAKLTNVQAKKPVVIFATGSYSEIPRLEKRQLLQDSTQTIM